MSRLHDGLAALTPQTSALQSVPRLTAPALSNLTLLQQLWSLLRPRAGLFFRLVGVAVLLALTEAVGLGVVLLFLGTTGSGAVLDWSWLPLPIANIMLGLSLASRVRLAALVLIAITLSRGVLRYFQHNLGSCLRIEILSDLQDQIFKQMHAVQLDYIQRERAGSLSALMAAYPTQIGRLIADVSTAIPNLVMLGGYVVLSLLVSWSMTVFIVSLMLLSNIALRRFITQRVKQASALAQELSKLTRSTVQEHLAGMKVIHLFNRAEWSLARYRSVQAEYYAQTHRADNLVALSAPLSGGLNVLLLSLSMVASTVLLTGSDEAQLAQLALFLLIGFRLLGPMAGLNHLQTHLAEYGPALQGVFDFLRRDDKPYLPNGTVPFTTLQQGITFEDVTFSYAPDEPPVLKKVSLALPKGQMTAVVGASGVGKTTLVNLITRLYDCTSGRICVDGVDVRDLEIGSWRSGMAVVTQDIFLFHDSALANLRFARPDTTPDEVIQAARLAHADDFIRDLPQGYDEPIYDRGARLSGGQQQRLAIARALLVDAEVLILDEATSDLDPSTERAIHQALAEYQNGRTVLVIAHRLSTIRNADRIYVLNAGCVVEHGTHDELMQAHGAYWQLVEDSTVN